LAFLLPDLEMLFWTGSRAVLAQAARASRIFSK
jgi:hypothetical protein